MTSVWHQRAPTDSAHIHSAAAAWPASRRRRYRERKPTESRETAMYGLISSMLVLPENRTVLTRALRSGSVDLPGCLSYVVADDAEDSSIVWVTEVWEDKEAHAASLELDHVKAAIAEAKHVIIGFGSRVETDPVKI
jgi:quinol monooxygenase YgiN